MNEYTKLVDKLNGLYLEALEQGYAGGNATCRALAERLETLLKDATAEPEYTPEPDEE